MATERAAETANPEVSIVIPALNEAESLPDLYARLTAAMEPLGVTYEIIFVDDGSRDGSAEIMEGMAEKDPRVGYIRHVRNHGKSLALMQGFDMARGRIAVTMDADLQDEPENIGILLDKMKSGNFDVVGGRRINRQDKTSKKIVSWIFNWLVSKVFGHRVHDVNSGFKAYSKKVYKRMELRGDLHRLTPIIAANNGFKICEVEVSHSNRLKGKSKYKLLRYRGLLDIFSLAATYSTQIRPFHVFGGLGFLSLILSAGLLAAYFVSIYTGFAAILKLPALVFSGALFVAGVNLLLLGLISEIIMSPIQNAEWRKNLIEESKLPAGRSADNSRS